MDSKAKRGPRPARLREAPEAGETEERISAVAGPAAAASAARAEDFTDLAREACEAFAQSQGVMARGFEALGLELVGLARSGIDRAAKTASEMLSVKTWSDAIDVNAGLARDSFDTFVDGSTRLSELGIKFAREAAQPLFAHWQKDWAKAFYPGL